MKALYDDRLKFLTPLFARVSARTRMMMVMMMTCGIAYNCTQRVTNRNASALWRVCVCVSVLRAITACDQNMLKTVVSVLPKRPATAPDIHRLGSVITDEGACVRACVRACRRLSQSNAPTLCADATAANGGTNYANFMYVTPRDGDAV
jgi:hypothetical protein